MSGIDEGLQGKDESGLSDFYRLKPWFGLAQRLAGPPAANDRLHSFGACGMQCIVSRSRPYLGMSSCSTKPASKRPLAHRNSMTIPLLLRERTGCRVGATGPPGVRSSEKAIARLPPQGEAHAD